MSRNASTWFCCQIGAREHYAVPRALRQVQRLGTLFTDAWAPKHPPFSWLSRLPVLRRFAGRHHAELASAPVEAYTGSLVAFEALQQARRRKGWERTIARNAWFERKVVRSLFYSGVGRLQPFTDTAEPAPVVFAYSYAALDIFRHAKGRGWRTVLGQIDPGRIEQDIVSEECAREPGLAQSWQIAPDRYWQRWHEELALADLVMVNSRWSYEALRRSGVPAEKLRVVPLAYESPTPASSQKRYPERFSRERPLRVLFLGQINLRKGVARLLRAARNLPDTVELWMVGPRQIASDPSLTENARVSWLAASTRDMAADYYRRADVLVLPTLSDGFAITQLEAMAHRLPVIASTHCGSVVRDGIDGLVLSEPSANAIEEALSYCLKNPERLAAFSREAYVRDEFSLASLAKNLLELEASVPPDPSVSEHQIAP